MASSLLFRMYILISFFVIISSLSPIIECQWYGTAPFCSLNNSCPKGSFKLEESKQGDGSSCWFSKKNRCCFVKQFPPPMINGITSNNHK
ncbi:hypothetical protein I4U23_017209 [Adineta vaga]|nr:hypothetical protein I4U23_017209 [Adineta vaga]